MNNITAVILAGGRATRMDGVDKGLLTFNKRPLIETSLQILDPWFETILININRNKSAYALYKKTLITDESEDYLGPLSGMLAALKIAKTDVILTIPCDMPFISMQILNKLLGKSIEAASRPVTVHDGNRLQPMVSLLHKSSIESLSDYLAAGDRKVDLWFERNNALTVSVKDNENQFFNINSKQDLTRAEEIFRSLEKLQ